MFEKLSSACLGTAKGLQLSNFPSFHQFLLEDAEIGRASKRLSENPIV